MAAWCCRVRFLVMAGAQCLLSSNPTYKRVCQRFHTTGHHHRHSSSLCFSLTATHAATSFPITPYPYDFFATSLAFGKGNKIAPLEKKEEEKEGEEGRYRLSPLSFSVYLSFSKEMSGSKNDALESWIRWGVAGFCTRREMEGNLFRRFKRRL